MKIEIDKEYIGHICQYCGDVPEVKNNYQLYNMPYNEMKGLNLVCESCDARTSVIEGTEIGKGLLMTLNDQRLRMRVEKYRDWIVEKAVKRYNISFDESYQRWQEWISKELEIDLCFVDPYFLKSKQMYAVINLSKRYKK